MPDSRSQVLLNNVPPVLRLRAQLVTRLGGCNDDDEEEEEEEEEEEFEEGVATGNLCKFSDEVERGGGESRWAPPSGFQPPPPSGFICRRDQGQGRDGRGRPWYQHVPLKMIPRTHIFSVSYQISLC